MMIRTPRFSRFGATLLFLLSPFPTQKHPLRFRRSNTDPSCLCLCFIPSCVRAREQYQSGRSFCHSLRPSPPFFTLSDLIPFSVFSFIFSLPLFRIFAQQTPSGIFSSSPGILFLHLLPPTTWIRSFGFHLADLSKLFPHKPRLTFSRRVL